MFHGKILCPILDLYVGMLSPASGPAVLHQGDGVVSLYVQTALSLWKSSLDGLASSHVLHLTLSGAPKILLYCTEYRRPTSSPIDLIDWHWFQWRYLVMFKVSSCNEVVTSTSPLPQSWHLLDVNLTHLASDLGQMRQKYVCAIPF